MGITLLGTARVLEAAPAILVVRLGRLHRQPLLPCALAMGPGNEPPESTTSSDVAQVARSRASRTAGRRR